MIENNARGAARMKFFAACAAVSLVASVPLTSSIAGETAGFLPAKSGWISDASVVVKESYDDNVFAAGADLPAVYPATPGGSVLAVKDKGSWVTTVSPKIGFNIGTFAGTNIFQTLSMAYAPEFAIYHNAASESYDAHRFLTATKGRVDAVSFSVDNTFSYIHGSQFGPYYPGGYNCYMNAAVRERREQIQDRAAVSGQYDFGNCFVRPGGQLAYYDLMTEQINLAGYQSYVDRYDANGGADFGWKFSTMAVTIGYRFGHQFQDFLEYSPLSSSSDYQRVLLGFEGKPWKWLDVRLLGGPDFRDYAASAAVNDRHPVKYYGEAMLTATATANDTFAFKYKQWQWVSSTGKVPYFDSAFELNYHRRICRQAGFDLGGKLLSSDYNSGNLATCKRMDVLYAIASGVTYAVNSHLDLNLGFTAEFGRNAQDNISNPGTRAYDRHIASLGVLFKY